MKFDFGQAVSEEMFKECGRQTDNKACLYYKLKYEPEGSGELIIFVVKNYQGTTIKYS